MIARDCGPSFPEARAVFLLPTPEIDWLGSRPYVDWTWDNKRTPITRLEFATVLEPFLFGASDSMRSIGCIDDSAVIQNVVRMVLSREGRSVVTYSSAEEFLSAGKTFDQLIVDVNLPCKSGIELLTELRLSGDTTPVILFSGSISDELIGSIKVFEDVSVLHKPFQVHELIELLVA